MNLNLPYFNLYSQDLHVSKFFEGKNKSWLSEYYYSFKYAYQKYSDDRPNAYLLHQNLGLASEQMGTRK